MKYRIIVELEEDERTELMKAVQDHPLDYEQDYWKRMTWDENKQAIVYCIVSTQTRYESVEKFSKSSEAKSVWKLPPSKIESILRHYAIRFPKKKAQWVSSLDKIDVEPIVRELERYDGRNVDSARQARSKLAEVKDQLGLKGLGPKELSHLLTKWLNFTRDVIPLDSRWDRFFRMKGVFKEQDEPRYVLYENLVITMSKELGLSPAELDEAVWYKVGDG